MLLSSLQFHHSVMSDSLQPHGLQHTRLPCPSPAPEDHSNSCPSSQWCHPTISSSVIPFSSCLQSFPTSGSFQMSQFFTSVGQSIGDSASTSILPMNIQDWSPVRHNWATELNWTDYTWNNFSSFVKLNRKTLSWFWYFLRYNFVSKLIHEWIKIKCYNVLFF